MRSKHMTKIDENQTRSASPWIAFRYKAFTVVWIATVVANVGTWMYNAASGWLMTSLTLDPLTVSLVQVASSLPMFLFALPAGALPAAPRTRRPRRGRSLACRLAYIQEHLSAESADDRDFFAGLK